MAPAMKAMKKAGASGLSATAAFSKVADSTELKPKQVKAVITSYLALAAGELKKSGKFKLGGMLNMKLKKKPVMAAAVLGSVAKKLNSLCLSVIAAKVRLDAFTKVKNDTVAQLWKEKADESKHEDFYVEEFNTNQADREEGSWKENLRSTDKLAVLLS